MRSIKLAFVLLFLFLFQPKESFSFSSEVDSLLRIKDTLPDDSNKVKVINAIINLFFENNDQKIMAYSHEAIDIARKINFKKGLADAMFLRGRACINISQKLGDATTMFLESLTIYEQLLDSSGISNSHLQLGLISYLLKDYANALKSFNKSELFEPYSKNSGVKIYLMALAYSEMDSVARAKEYFRRAIEIYTRSNYARGLFECYAYLGKLHNSLGQPDSAIYFIENGLHFYSDSSGTYGRAAAFLSQSYLLKNDLDKAQYYGEIALKEIDNNLTNEYALHVLYKVYFLKGEYKKAFLTLENYKQLVDSQYNNNVAGRVLELNSRFEFDKKASALLTEQKNKEAIAKKELEKQKLIRNGFLGGFAIVLLFAVIFLRQRNNISKEKGKSEKLLLNIIPEEVALELKNTGEAKAKSFDLVTVMFTDFKDFTMLSEKMSGEKLVQEIHTCFSAFDKILLNYKIEKIKTIGDAYLCASGLPLPSKTQAVDMIEAAMEIKNFMVQRKKEMNSMGELAFEMRIGIHTGPVVAGIVGIRKYAYDIWGDTVNMAARMEQNSEPGKINISGSTYTLVKDFFHCTYRGKISAKNKGELDMYFIEGRI